MTRRHGEGKTRRHTGTRGNGEGMTRRFFPSPCPPLPASPCVSLSPRLPVSPSPRVSLSPSPKEESMPRQSGKDRFARVRELYAFDEQIRSRIFSLSPCLPLPVSPSPRVSPCLPLPVSPRVSLSPCLPVSPSPRVLLLPASMRRGVGPLLDRLSSAACISTLGTRRRGDAEIFPLPASPSPRVSPSPCLLFPATWARLCERLSSSRSLPASTIPSEFP